MSDVVSVRFRNRGKSYYFDPNGLAPQEGQSVVVETSKGLELGDCSSGVQNVPESSLVAPLRPVVRLATAEDLRVAAQNRVKEKSAFSLCEERIAAHKLEMKLVDVEYSFEGNKILFFFTADGRVDFRELVKDLASTFHARIELRQIGVRDGAKMLGGLGICGRPFCCSTFLQEFQPVSIRMAKTQSLSLNPTKISGTCGRLMCCLKYEQDAYEDLMKTTPKVDSEVDTPKGKGVITEISLLRRRVKVRLAEGPDTTTLQTWHLDRLGYHLGGSYKEPLPEEPKQPEEPDYRALGYLGEATPIGRNLQDEDRKPGRSRNRRKKQAEQPEQPFAKPESSKPKPQKNRADRPPRPEGGGKPRPPKPEGGKPRYEQKPKGPRPEGGKARPPRSEGGKPRPPKPAQEGKNGEKIHNPFRHHNRPKKPQE